MHSEIAFLGWIFLVNAVFAYAVMRLCFRFVRTTGGYGLGTDAAILVLTFLPAYHLVSTNVRHDPGCLYFGVIGGLGLRSVAAFLPSIPWLRVRLGRWAPVAGLAIGIAAVATEYFTYSIDPQPDYSNCL